MDKMSSKFGLPESLLDAVRQVQIQENEYQAKVKALMAKRGIKSLSDLTPEQKKEFFNTLDSMHKAKDEQSFMRNPMGAAKKILQSSNDVKEDAGASKKKEDEFHTKLDKLVHKTFGHSSDEKKMKKEEANLDEAKKPVSKEDVTKLLIKYGNNPQSAKKMVDAEFASAVKRHPEASASKIAEVIRSVAEEIGINEMDKSQPSSSRGAEGVPVGKKAYPVKTDKVKSNALKVLQKIYKDKKVKEEVEDQKKGVAEGSLNEADTFKSWYDWKDQAKHSGYTIERDNNNKIVALNNKGQVVGHWSDVGKFLSGKAPRQQYKKVKEEIEIEEGKSGTGYELYHKDFSSAMAHAYDFAKKKYNIEVDPKEIDRNVAMGPKKPSSGKANAYRLLDRTGKRAIQVQVTNLDNKRYELNMYKEEVEEERDPPFTPDKPKKNPGVVPGKRGVGPSVAKHLAKMAMKKQQEKKPMKEEESLEESGGDVVWKKGNDHIEKYGDEKFALYKDGKKTKYYKSMDDAKAALEELANPQKSMKRASLSVARAQEVMRHRKEIGSIRKKREALREKEEVTKDKDQVTTKQKAHKKGETLSGKKEPITINPEVDEKK
jgi:hypothetical protein